MAVRPSSTATNASCGAPAERRQVFFFFFFFFFFFSGTRTAMVGPVGRTCCRRSRPSCFTPSGHAGPTGRSHRDPFRQDRRYVRSRLRSAILAAHLCNADLVERHGSASPRVAGDHGPLLRGRESCPPRWPYSIGDHYSGGPNDRCPIAPISIGRRGRQLARSSFWSDRLKPTVSRDPSPCFVQHSGSFASCRDGRGAAGGFHQVRDLMGFLA